MRTQTFSPRIIFFIILSSDDFLFDWPLIFESLANISPLQSHRHVTKDSSKKRTESTSPLSSPEKISIIRKKFSLFLSLSLWSMYVVKHHRCEREREGIFTYIKLIEVVAINIRFNVLGRNFSLEKKFVWRYHSFGSTLNFSLRQKKSSLNDDAKETHRLREKKN